MACRVKHVKGMGWILCFDTKAEAEHAKRLIYDHVHQGIGKKPVLLNNPLLQQKHGPRQKV